MACNVRRDRESAQLPRPHVPEKAASRASLDQSASDQVSRSGTHRDIGGEPVLGGIWRMTRWASARTGSWRGSEAGRCFDPIPEVRRQRLSRWPRSRQAGPAKTVAQAHLPLSFRGLGLQSHYLLHRKIRRKISQVKVADSCRNDEAGNGTRFPPGYRRQTGSATGSAHRGTGFPRLETRPDPGAPPAGDRSASRSAYR
jgi:hypothetical protein